MGKSRAVRAPALVQGDPVVAAYVDLRAALSPEKPLTVSEWADKYRVLPPEEAEPGPWRTSRTPYLRDIMDALSSHRPEERIVFMKGGQLGGTEVGNNWLGYVIHHSPARMLLVQPTTEMAKRNSKTRIDKLIEASPVLRSRVRPPRSADTSNTILSKEFPGGVAVMTGANSAVGLRSMPARDLFLDEVDAYPGDVDGEGDPVALAEQRTVTFKGKRKIFLCSTPGVKGFSRIERAFLLSDQRFYFVPCPSCGEMQRLRWTAPAGSSGGSVKWPKGRPGAAYYECAACQVEIPHHLKLSMLEAGEWRATAPGDGKTAGFHLSSLYSPWVTWGDMAEEFVKAGRDPALLKPFVNMKLAETWEDKASEALDAEGLMARREDWGQGVPEGAGVITAAVDVQDDRLEVGFWGWGRDEESWSLDHRILYGDPSTPLLWAELDELLLRQDMKPAAVCVDTGGHHTLAAYAFCRERAARRVWAIKGATGKRPVWPRRPSKSNKGRVNLFLVGVDSAKETIYGRLRSVTEPGPGFMHFPMDRDAEHFEQLTAERTRVKYSKGFASQYWFKPDGRRNEALDVAVYAYAALHGLISMGLQLNRRVAQVAAAREAGRQAPPPPDLPSGQPPVNSARRVIRSSYMDG